MYRSHCCFNWLLDPSMMMMSPRVIPIILIQMLKPDEGP